MRALIAEKNSTCIMMHHLSIPVRREQVLPRDQDPVTAVYAFAEKHIQTLEEAGIPRAHIIFDPGIGFGKTAEQSLLLLKSIPRFKTLGVKILVGHSRKKFLSLFTNLPFAERDIETLTLALYLANQVDYLRVHDVQICARAFKVASALPPRFQK
jgi:2-amino-4-hydroxy-6-hydroxymethyldihydropteridine diphosphokinase / dihydropteroate synthase